MKRLLLLLQRVNSIREDTQRQAERICRLVPASAAVNITEGVQEMDFQAKELEARVLALGLQSTQMHSAPYNEVDASP